jgi:hypothetical protein
MSLKNCSAGTIEILNASAEALTIKMVQSALESKEPITGPSVTPERSEKIHIVTGKLR